MKPQKHRHAPHGMPNLRRMAKHKDCYLRLPHVCNDDPKTVVLCHLGGYLAGGGRGVKCTDLAAAPGCSDCHRVVDNHDLSASERALRERWIHEHKWEGFLLRAQWRWLKDVGEALGT